MSALPGVTIATKLFAASPTPRGDQTSHPAGNGLDVDGVDAVVAAFHRWIREDLVEGQLPIDVADYRHVRGGPGVVLACHRGFLSFGGHGGRQGLRFELKHGGRGDPGELFRALLRTVGSAALRLLRETGLRGRLEFPLECVEVRVEDRLSAPRSPDTLVNLRQRLEPIVAGLFAGADRIEIDEVLGTAGFGLDLRIGASPDLEVVVARTRGAP